MTELYGYGIAIIWMGLYWMSWTENQRLKERIAILEDRQGLVEVMTDREKALASPLLYDRPGATCSEIPSSLIEDIAASLGIPPERLEADRSGIAIMAEQKSLSCKVREKAK